MKIMIYFLLLIGLPFHLSAQDSLSETDWTLEIRGACYSPQSNKIREIYSRAWIDYQVLTSKKIASNVEFWGQVSWSIKKGSTSKGKYGFKDRTRAWILPIAAGVRFIYPVACRTHAYFGAGACYSFLKIDNRCENIYDYYFRSNAPFHKHIRKHEIGGLFKMGVLFETGDKTFIDLFADYYLQNFHLGHHNLFEEKIIKHKFQASGFKFGAGFGVNF